MKGKLGNSGESTIIIQSIHYSPGNLKLVSFVQNSKKVSEFNAYVIKVQLSHDIPKDGMISVHVPQDS